MAQPPSSPPNHRLFSGLAVVVGLSLTVLPVLSHAPNRLLSGQPIGFWELPLGAVIVIVATLAAMLGSGLAVGPQKRALGTALVASLLLPLEFLVVAGHVATDLATRGSPFARTTLAAGGWLCLALCALSAGEAVRRLALSTGLQALIFILAVAAVGGLMLNGVLDDLSLLKEWSAKRDVFGDAVSRHLLIVGAVLLPTCLIGFPLGVLAHRHARVRGPLLAVLGIIQTIPSIALFGLLMAPLSALSQAFPWLAEVGIRGIGLTPAILALTAYALLPVVRNTVEGLLGVEETFVDAGVGLGMTARQLFFQVQLPLALPVIVAGLRVTIVQTVGLAAVAALIGAGGLGSLMFQGLFSNASDLIVLGALPVMLLAVGIDIVFRLLSQSLWQKTEART